MKLEWQKLVTVALALVITSGAELHGPEAPIATCHTGRPSPRCHMLVM